MITPSGEFPSPFPQTLLPFALVPLAALALQKFLVRRQISARLPLFSCCRSEDRTWSICLRRGNGGTGKCAKKSHGVSDKPYDDDRFATLAQLEIQRLRVALGSPSQSLGEDAQAEL